MTLESVRFFPLSELMPKELADREAAVGLLALELGLGGLQGMVQFSLLVSPLAVFYLVQDREPQVSLATLRDEAQPNTTAACLGNWKTIAKRTLYLYRPFVF